MQQIYTAVPHPVENHTRKKAVDITPLPQQKYFERMRM
jgi:hypothetical protein